LLIKPAQPHATDRTGLRITVRAPREQEDTGRLRKIVAVVAVAEVLVDFVVVGRPTRSSG
jgi:hypothetical protein